MYRSYKFEKRKRKNHTHTNTHISMRYKHSKRYLPGMLAKARNCQLFFAFHYPFISIPVSARLKVEV